MVAEGFRSEAAAVLATSGAGSDIIVGGDVKVVVASQLGTGTLSLTSQGGLVVEKNFIARMQAAQSQVNINSRFVELMEIRSALILDAAADYSAVTAAFNGIAGSSLGSQLDLKSDVEVNSSGFRSVSSLQMSQVQLGETRVGGNVTIQAMGDESIAVVSDDLEGGKIALAKDVAVRAVGAYAEARFEVRNDPPSAPGNLTPVHTIGGILTAEAAGAGSTSAIEVALKGWNDVSVGSTVSATSTGYLSSAALNLSTWFGSVSLPALMVDASGVASHSFVTLKAGEAPVAGEPSLTAGHLAIAGVVSVRAGALAAQAEATLDVPNGDISAGGLNVDAFAARSVSNLVMQAGSTKLDSANNELNAAPGKLTVSGDTQVRASGTESMASLLASSENDTLSFGGSLKLIAAATEAQATLNAHASSSYLEGLADISPSAKLVVAGDLTAIASNTQANASAVLVSEMDELSIGGNLKLLASGDQAKSTVDLSAISGALNLSGDLAASSVGNASVAELFVISYVDTAVFGASELFPGPIDVAGNVLLNASGTNAVSKVSLLARNPYSSLSLHQDVSVQASGVGSAATLTLSDTARPAEAHDLAVDGMLRLTASAAASVASAVITSTNNDASMGGLTISAAGSESQVDFSANAKGSLGLTQSGLQVRASGYDSAADVTLSAETGALSVNGSVSLIASGDASDIEATLTSTAAALTIEKDVSAAALGDGSRIGVTLSQSAGAAVAVAGQIQLLADSGTGSAAGATTTAQLAVGSFGTKDFDLVMSAVQSGDRAEASLQLSGHGGGIKIGGAAQQGTAELTLAGDSGDAGNSLVDKIDIDFAGTSGHAVLHFNIDQDHLTSSELQKVTLSGFRLDTDELHFGNLLGLDYETGITTVGTFTTAALSHFEDAPGAGVFAGGAVSGNTTFVAYDLDGTGVSAIIVLDGVNINEFADRYQTPTGLG